MRLIDADALLEELAGDYNNLEGMPPDLEAAVYAIMDAPTVDITPKEIPKALARAISVLVEYFTEGVYSPRVRNPIAWALYHTWKKIDTEG